MHKLNMKHFVWTMASFVAILYAICRLLFFIAPATAMAVFRQWFHGIDISLIASQASLPLADFVLGLITSMIATAIFSAIFVGLWNKFYKRMEAGA